MRVFVLIIFFVCTNLGSNELIFTCENNYSYKFSNIKNNQKSFFKYKTDSWIEIRNFHFSENKLELFIPNLEYMGCADKNLAICKYSIRINNLTEIRPSVTEVVQNDCYIGTMGCNEYKKGLELNKSYCKVN